MHRIKKLFSLIALFAFYVTSFAEVNDDFASFFVQQHKDDQAIKCETISPAMIEQIASQIEDFSESGVIQTIKKLKSVRIITASSQASLYYNKAEQLLKSSSLAFNLINDYSENNLSGDLYSLNIDGETSELVLILIDNNKELFTIVDITGVIDADFMENLVKSFAP